MNPDDDADDDLTSEDDLIGESEGVSAPPEATEDTADFTTPPDRPPAAEAPPAEPGPPVEAEQYVGLTTSPAASAIAPAGIVDDLLGNAQILLPFILDPNKMAGVIDGCYQAVNGETVTAKWQGTKRVGDLLVPLVEKFVDRVKLSRQPRTAVLSVPVAFLEQSREAVSILQMRSFAEAYAHVEAKRIGDGAFLRRLRESLGEFANSPMGQALLRMALERLMGGLVPTS